MELFRPNTENGRANDATASIMLTCPYRLGGTIGMIKRALATLKSIPTNDDRVDLEACRFICPNYSFICQVSPWKDKIA